MLKAILRDSLIYGLASVLSRGLAIFLLPLYTRVLSTGDYGAFDLLITLGALVNLTVALEVSQGLARYWGDIKEPSERRTLASTTFWFTLGMYSVFLLAGLLASSRLNLLVLGDAAYLDTFRLGLGFITINGIYYLLLNQFRWELRSKAYAMVSFGYALMTLAFAVVFCLLLGKGLEGVMLGQLLAALCSTLICLWLLRTTFGFSFDVERLAAMLKFSMPLVPAGLAVFVSLYINRVALMHFGSLQDVGLFGIGSRVAGLSALLLLGIQAALTPLVYQHYREPETPGQIARLFSWFVAVALAGCLFLAVFARELLTVFATADYLGGASLVAFLAPALLLSQMYIFAPGIAIQKKTIWQLWVTLLSAAVSAGANWLLVPLWGVYGAATATLLAALVFFVAWLLVSQRLYRIPYNWRACASGVVAFIICAWVSAQLDQWDLYLPLTLMLKSLLLIALSIVVVASGLLPLADIRALLLQVRQRVGRRSNV
ncbi:MULTISPECIES: oligosaccharide flippase family protein [unclassified Pseudomonas]|jgi:O-antigen/teichoic acid export membrane protein|uniref:oligosaccharide flippase family protein n=1 Tax=unclassified Pseudomonas TaxID=196821 RepID=UPI00069DBBDB|nr:MULTISPECIES: oligosaccharide flippase family protein [unclassified Pseudomonas]MBY8945260.1 oligosaccharide flippase family protein [Pseudomonas sp. SH10-3B]MCP1468080.1 O-antigen/teichoic acid export membrane protein [Pseudomonas sp. S3E17]